MILHVANLDKFIPPFVEFVNKNFSPEEHLYYLYGDDTKYTLDESANVILTRRSRLMSLVHYFKAIPKLIQARKVIIHGLFDIRFVLLLCIMPFVLKKCYWVIWGGDLYQYQKPKKTVKDNIKERLRAFVIKRFGYLVTYIPGDVALAREWYGATGEYQECLMYLSNIVDDKLVHDVRNDPVKQTTINILVGNSADPSNNHFEALDKLSSLKAQDIHIFVPLSYGDQEHAKAVISYGNNLFAEKFIALTEFMPIDEYNDFLSSIDIAVFNHKRQQGMGNTISLLGMGKKVYMRTDVSQNELFSTIGVQIFPIENLSLELATEEVRIKNQSLILETFSVLQLKNQWSKIFVG